MLSNKQKQAITLFVSAPLTQKEIAEKIGVSSMTISNWMKNDEFTAEIEKANRRAFSSAASKAQRKMIEWIDSKNESISFAACRDVLDRSGYKPIDKSEMKLSDVNISIDYGDDTE